MSIKSSKDTLLYRRFKAALEHRLTHLGKNRRIAAEKLGIEPNMLFSMLNRGTSAAIMEKTAEKLEVDLIDLLIEGQNIIDNQL